MWGVANSVGGGRRNWLAGGRVFRLRLRDDACTHATKHSRRRSKGGAGTEKRRPSPPALPACQGQKTRAQRPRDACGDSSAAFCSPWCRGAGRARRKRKKNKSCLCFRRFALFNCELNRPPFSDARQRPTHAHAICCPPAAGAARAAVGLVSTDCWPRRRGQKLKLRWRPAGATWRQGELV